METFPEFAERVRVEINASQYPTTPCVYNGQFVDRNNRTNIVLWFEISNLTDTKATIWYIDNLLEHITNPKRGVQVRWYPEPISLATQNNIPCIVLVCDMASDDPETGE